MKQLKYILFYIFICAGCKERYELPLNSADKSLLVVDGLINNGAAPTNIRLSRSIKLDRSAQEVPELSAEVKIEGSDNSSVQLNHNGNGNYTIPQLNLSADKLYRLRIRTSNGNEYLSDFVPVKSTPEIDSINWKRVNGDLVIYANTHDPQNDTWYYRWDFSETWEIRSAYYSYLKFVNGAIIQRNLPADDVSVCWKYSSSNNIILGSSVRLQSDVVKEAPLLEIPAGSEKLGVRYSILVRQHALTREAYDFLQIMKRNTESLGTIFDPQPSEVKGNIRNVNDPLERVIGMISVANIKEKRIFISNFQLPGWGYTKFCPTIFVEDHPDSIRKYFPAYFPYDYSGTGYNASFPTCVDCTTRGGFNTKPAY